MMLADLRRDRWLFAYLKLSNSLIVHPVSKNNPVPLQPDLGQDFLQIQGPRLIRHNSFLVPVLLKNLAILDLPHGFRSLQL